MASQIFRKFLSIFYPQPAKGEEMPSSRTVNRVFGDWATSAVEDLPPPYTDLPESKVRSQDEKHFTSSPYASSRLQICPHEALSFEGLRKIAESLAISSNDVAIDALTRGCCEHRSQLDPTTKGEKNICTSSPGLLRGFGTYISDDDKDSSPTPDVVLCFHWDLGVLAGIRGQIENAAELQQFLGADGIRLCPHKQLSDSDVVNAVFGFVQRPSGQDVFTRCDRCETEIKVLATVEGDDRTCRVVTKRRLGTGKKPDDPVWLAQCDV